MARFNPGSRVQAREQFRIFKPVSHVALQRADDGLLVVTILGECACRADDPHRCVDVPVSIVSFIAVWPIAISPVLWRTAGLLETRGRALPGFHELPVVFRRAAPRPRVKGARRAGGSAPSLP